MTQNPLKGEESPTETDIVGPAVPTEIFSSHRLTNELAMEWETEAERLAQIGAQPQAILLRHCAQKLFEAIKGENGALLTLEVAAQMCGYSADHLSRLVRQGKLTNHGRKGSPKLRFGDLPQKPRAVAAPKSPGYSPNTDARSIRSRGRRNAA